MIKSNTGYYQSEYLVTTRNLFREAKNEQILKLISAARVSTNYKYLVCTAIITFSYWSLCKAQDTLKYKDESYFIVK